MLKSLLVFLATGFAAYGANCPQPEFLHPCTCRPWESGIFVVCHQVNNTSRLRTIFQLLRDYEISRLLLKDCHLIETSGSGIFSRLKVKLLRLVDSSLTRTDPRQRQEPIADLASHIERLDLTNCQGLFRVGQMSLVNLHKLKDLNVIRDDVGVLRRNWLPNPSNITNLRLEQCSISEVETGALSHMNSLKSLTLMRNQLTRIRRDALPQSCMDLVSIDLSENQIGELPENFFNGMSNLHTVNFYENQLHTLNQSIWSPVWSRLDKLWINNNQITCDESMEWIFDQGRSPPVLYGDCSAPDRLRGTALSSLSRQALQRH